MIELNKIYCGDNCDLLGQLPRECVDLVVTSPPYDDLRTYGGHTWDFYGVAWQLKRVLKPGGVIVWVVADATKDGSETGTSMEQALHFKRLGLNLHDTMIYHKANYLPLTHNRYEQAFEYMFVFSKGRPATFTPKMTAILYPRNRDLKMRDGDGKKQGRQDSKENRICPNVFEYKTGGGHIDADGFAHLHPAPFPEKLAKDHVLSWSNPGDLVLDPFTGSGTTCKAAKELGRNFLGFEINPEYCKIAERRIAQEVLDFAS